MQAYAMGDLATSVTNLYNAGGLSTLGGVPVKALTVVAPPVPSSALGLAITPSPSPVVPGNLSGAVGSGGAQGKGLTVGELAAAVVGGLVALALILFACLCAASPHSPLALFFKGSLTCWDYALCWWCCSPTGKKPPTRIVSSSAPLTDPHHHIRPPIDVLDYAHNHHASGTGPAREHGHEHGYGPEHEKKTKAASKGRPHIVVKTVPPLPHLLHPKTSPEGRHRSPPLSSGASATHPVDMDVSVPESPGRNLPGALGSFRSFMPSSRMLGFQAQPSQHR